jgi:hypothetical protein
MSKWHDPKHYFGDGRLSFLNTREKFDSEAVKGLAKRDGPGNGGSWPDQCPLNFPHVPSEIGFIRWD